MWFDPRLRTIYRPRETLRSLWRQYYEYGYWRAVTLRKHRRLASMRQSVPPACVLGAVGGLVVAPFSHRLRSVWLAGMAAWLTVLTAAAGRERAAGVGVAARSGVAVACLHLAYGAGFWVGMIKGPRLRGR